METMIKILFICKTFGSIIKFEHNFRDEIDFFFLFQLYPNSKQQILNNINNTVFICRLTFQLLVLIIITIVEKTNTSVRIKGGDIISLLSFI